ncbi:gephyrin-like molybdotransferase Glp [Undibacterium sp.]|jgi:molybdopterin molybdotransferase|uniref:molybdopterin molybdotransferase MoeA n=1 Tax=Undibacterium sp. TaxID=1914977 RepID=UPI002B70499F|nr:gephyrin-like molybdotransferase Glp [Undibacterium sp.]HTD07239.1 gephyrin-like molybdotransferase Glp [Undibacterium sp.]
MPEQLPHAPAGLHTLLNGWAGYDADAVPVALAQHIIKQFIAPAADAGTVEKLPLRSALDRVLASDIVSGINVPAYDNSAMDGYAFHGADLVAAQPAVLKIVGVAYAGRAFDGQVGRGECIRIMTGAVMPAGLDTVIPQELAQDVTADAITIASDKIKSGDNRRLKGEDLALGKIALVKGKILRPADLGLLASLGIAEVSVRPRLRVAFFSTGDELRSVGEALDEGCVYDSNRYTLHGMLTRLGCEVIDMGIVRDDPASLQAAFHAACQRADAIITSGGVSVGAADYTRQIMAAIGEVAFWSINMRPGRPMAFGKVCSDGKSAYLFGLPGNPVAVMVSFYFFVRDALLQMAGAQVAPLPMVKAISSAAIRKRPGRTEYQRGILSATKDGNLQVRITGSQGSGILRSMAEANCMVVLHDEQADVATGDRLDVVLFDSFQ